MAEPKPLTYDEQKAAEAAFSGGPSNPHWTEAAKLLYLRLSAELNLRTGQSGSQNPPSKTDLTTSRR